MTEQEIADILSPFVQAIMRATSSEAVEFVGSGFLLNNNNTIRLVTAAHVIDLHDEEKSPLFIATDTGFVRIKGDSCSTVVKNGAKRNDDKIDIAVVTLDADINAKFRNISFVIPEMLDLTNIHDSSLGYFAMGFPVKRSNKSIDQIIKVAEPELYIFHAAEADECTFEKLGVRKESHIVLDFEKKRVFSTTGVRRTAPDLNGLSGTPIWGMVRTNAAEVKAKIVAILTEHHQRDIKAVLGMRLCGLPPELF